MNISEYLASLKQVSSQWIVAAVKYQIMVLWVKIDSKLLKKFYNIMVMLFHASYYSK